MGKFSGTRCQFKQDLPGISPFSQHPPSEFDGLFQGPFTHAISVEETGESRSCKLGAISPKFS